MTAYYLIIFALSGGAHISFFPQKFYSERACQKQLQIVESKLESSRKYGLACVEIVRDAGGL